MGIFVAIIVLVVASTVALYVVQVFDIWSPAETEAEIRDYLNRSAEEGGFGK